MKNLKEYIIESSETFDAKLSSQFRGFCENLVRNVDYSKLKETDEYDPNRFDISKENEQLFIDSFAETNKEFHAISSQEYFAILNPDKKFENLSAKEKSDFDTKYGDIIIIDDNDKPVCFVDIKISNNYFGAVSLGSLANFVEDGCYICVNKSKYESVFVSHKALVEKVKEDQDKFLHPVIKGRKYEGYPIKWEGQDLTSEYFVPGNQIAKFK